MRQVLLPVCLVVFVGLALLSPSPSHAAETDSEKAKRLFREGTNYYDLGEFPKAIEAYKAGYLIKQDPIFLFNIAQAYRMLKDYNQALIFYKSYLRNRPDAPNRNDVMRRIEEMEAASKASGSPPNLPAPAAATPLPQPRDTNTQPPPSESTTTAPPPPPATLTPPPLLPDSAAGSSSNPAVANNAEPVVHSYADSHTGADAPKSIKPWLPWVVVGAGGALMLGGVFTGLAAQGLQSELEEECPTRMNCSERARDLQSQGESMAITTDVLLFGGAALAATGVIWWALKFRNHAKTERIEEPRALVLFNCAPTTCSALARLVF